ncbi:MAG: prepilin-type N-terminal cleavage/methylation domain-containing protein [Nitrospirae bacterium]|nr:prepilin-type N-terminal cleavage/methylation domain-containing protein [Nitrospirota bacterium]
MIELRTLNSELRTSRGVTLIELLVVLTIFSIVMAGLYSAYSAQMKAGVNEYKLAQSEMEFQIGKMVMERDLAMAGYGIADNYSAVTPSFTPRVAAATDNNPDALTIVGTALGRESRATQAWSYTMIASAATTTDFYPFSTPTSTLQDVRENLRSNDAIVYMNATTRNLLATSAPNNITGKTWLFSFPPGGTNPRPDPLDMGIVAYGLQTQPTGSGVYADYPYYTVEYLLSATNSLSFCAPGSKNLLRSENRQNPPTDPGQPLFNCVLDFQVAFGIDTTEDGLIDCWDNGGITEAAGYPVNVLRTRFKQIKVYILVQQGKMDPNFTSPSTIRVGDASLNACGGGGVGRNVSLLATQTNYRWRVIALSVTPRNIR